MGDAAEGLIDADARIQERMEELERERTQTRSRPVKDPERLRVFESLRLARTELGGQLSATTNPGRRAQLEQAIAEVERRMAEAGALVNA